MSERNDICALSRLNVMSRGGPAHFKQDRHLRCTLQEALTGASDNVSLHHPQPTVHRDRLPL